jgi:hypothetical protein
MYIYWEAPEQGPAFFAGGDWGSALMLAQVTMGAMFV